MRDIIKNIQLPIDGKPMDFRLTKLDAFSGATLLQLLARTETNNPSPSARHPERGEGYSRQNTERSDTFSPEPSASHPERSEGSHPQSSPPGIDSSLLTLFAALPPADLRSLMTSCLNHVEVLLPAGYQPVMQGNSWSWPELEHDTASCLKLTLEEALWTLSGFFGEGGSASRPAAPTSSPPPART